MHSMGEEQCLKKILCLSVYYIRGGYFLLNISAANILLAYSMLRF